MLNSPAFIGRIGRANRGSLLLYPAYVQDYLDRVTAADVAAGDTAGLERGVTDAFNRALQDMVSDQVLGISGGIIAQAPSMIKAMPFMVGARTLPGCLVPAVGPAPTNYNFVPPDYDRKTGLLGDGATTYLDSNRAGDAEALNNQHMSVYVDTASTATNAYIGLGGDTGIYRNTALNAIDVRSRNSIGGSTGSINSIGFIGISRGNASNFDARTSGNTVIINIVSNFANPQNTTVFARQSGTSLLADARIAFYSIGEALDLALLDARVSALITAIDGAIP